MNWQSKHANSLRILLLTSLLMVGTACIAHGTTMPDDRGDIRNPNAAALKSADHEAPATLGPVELLILGTTGSLAIFSLRTGMRRRHPPAPPAGCPDQSIAPEGPDDRIKTQLISLHRELRQVEVALIELTKWPSLDDLQVFSLEERKRAIKRGISRLRSMLLPDLIA